MIPLQHGVSLPFYVSVQWFRCELMYLMSVQRDDFRRAACSLFFPRAIWFLARTKTLQHATSLR